jgi:hypothetical protein
LGIGALFPPCCQASPPVNGSQDSGETAVEAQAGFLDRPTLVVLIVSTGLMIGLFAVLSIGFFAR